MLLLKLAMAKRLDELPVFLKATEFTVAVSAILERPGFRRERRLHDQITDANDSILSNMSEGFEQPTDKALAKYLFDAKGSVAEVITRLQAAQRKKVLTTVEVAPLTKTGEEILRMLGGWIRYLAGCGWTDRGRHHVKDSPGATKGER
jgi:four helix bundle protein